MLRDMAVLGVLVLLTTSILAKDYFCSSSIHCIGTKLHKDYMLYRLQILPLKFNLIFPHSLVFFHS